MLDIEALSRRYGEVVALDDVTLSAMPGEFLTILGESGSGKTTLLRMISGLEEPSSVKRLEIEGRGVVGMPPALRNCTTVFQNYALFPHMSVGENVAYGLKVRGVPREEIRREVDRALAVVRLPGMAERRISQLSGGQKQRVAIARCLVTKPALMLLDEPLGALDERLRLDMQNELVDIQRELGMTFVYITHSQEEALAMSDRIVLMRLGRIEQLGVPSELFDRPSSAFAASFMGFENIFSGHVTGGDASCVLVAIEGGSQINVEVPSAARPQKGAAVKVALRAERLRGARADDVSSPSLNVVPARALERRYRGKYSDTSVETSAGVLKLRSWDRDGGDGELRAVAFQPSDCVLLEASA